MNWKNWMCNRYSHFWRVKINKIGHENWSNYKSALLISITIKAYSSCKVIQWSQLHENSVVLPAPIASTFFFHIADRGLTPDASCLINRTLCMLSQSSAGRRNKLIGPLLPNKQVESCFTNTCSRTRYIVIIIITLNISNMNWSWYSVITGEYLLSFESTSVTSRQTAGVVILDSTRAPVKQLSSKVESIDFQYETFQA
jgi:hypothetical protein